MSEDFSEDFVLEDEEVSEGSGRSFLITAGALIGVFIILAGCLLGYVVLQQNDSSQANEATRVFITNTNATTAAENALVEQTRQALEEQEAIAEVEAEATNQAIATAEAEEAALPATSTPEPEETEVDAAATEAAREAAIADAAATATAEAAAAGGDGSSTGDGDGATTLPETGIEVWLIAAGALGLIAVLFVSRRLRTSQ